MLVNVIRRTDSSSEFLSSLSRMMDEAFGVGSIGAPRASAWTPACDVLEDQDNLKIVVEVPGLKPEEIKVGLENQLLTVQGEKRRESEAAKDRWHRFERTFGRFERTFTVPRTVDVERITAKAENGILTLTLPKAEKARPRQIQVAA